VLILLSAPLIAIMLTAYVFQSYQVDGPSMQESLHHNDRLIVWKTPRTWARITGNQYVPNRGDVIIFTQTNLVEHGDNVNTKQLVKRVIGLPGDQVVIKDGVITVYNKDNPKGFNPDTTLPYGEEGVIQSTEGNYDVTLEEDQLFVSGDNRANSLDSRTFGPISTDQVIGKLVIRILPVSDVKLF
jgi:signal peptidase I